MFTGNPGKYHNLTVESILTGGTPESVPKAEITEFQAPSNNIFLNPIPGEILHTAHYQP
jgi:hypothetical protein